jgi:hypothetical protein
MPSSPRKALAAHRRLKHRGVVRIELRVKKADALLLRGVAEALADPTREAEMRALLREHVVSPPAKGLKALLAAAPLEGIDLTRAQDTDRRVDLRTIDR